MGVPSGARVVKLLGFYLIGIISDQKWDRQATPPMEREKLRKGLALAGSKEWGAKAEPALFTIYTFLLLHCLLRPPLS